MGPRYLKEGEGFGPQHFPSDFGFTGSSVGRHDPRSHPSMDSDEYGDKAALKRESEMPTMAKGGRTPKVPVPKAAKAAMGALALGRLQGARAARPKLPAPPPAMPIAAAPRAPMPMPGPMPGGGAPPMPMGVPAMKSGGHMDDGDCDDGDYAAGGKFIQKGIRHPGRMKNLAKRHGIGVHQEMERDKHSSDPSLRSAANLGLRLTGGDLSPRKKR